MEKPSRSYETRRRTKSEETTVKSRVDWRRTKRNSVCLVPDSDEDDLCSEEEAKVSEEEKSISEAEDCDDKEQQQQATVSNDDAEEECVKQSRRRRKSAVMESSDSSSDSDGPIRKVYSKRRCLIDEEEEAGEGKNPGIKTETNEIEEETEEETDGESIKKRKKLENLQKLAEKRKSKSGGRIQDYSEDEESDFCPPLSSEETSDIEDNGSLKDFIVDDEEEDTVEGITEEKQLASHQNLFLKHHIPLLSSSDHYTHLQRVVNAFLINITSPDFLDTLYEKIRTKKYAKDMLNSLYCLDERIIQPRLENLSTRSRWSKRYRERIDCYPDLRVNRGYGDEQSCQACELHRFCKYTVVLSGQAYNCKTMEVDEFLPNDKQVLKVGRICANRTKVYHQLKHFKYHLYQVCIPAIEDITQYNSVKERVETCLAKMEKDGVIKKQADFLEAFLNEADFFHEEKMD
ncbi:coiled-coil domain-containing protein 82 [Xenopus laevis]|uniref:Coiled-coil domain-containing protein 82 n=2 Tax=Xenopus laevis TaxID=8355 RepID=A0A1L8HJA7_XENLA|nr:coiled-coil domain-containing protein 82 [Xenopus laevis]OCT96165.1 hypothetical protein XELAEV_18013848mg [Xenopus laevis]